MSNEWKPGRWWLVTYADGRLDDDGTLQVWCETSDEEEAREALGTCPGGGELRRQYWRTEHEWRVES